MTIPGSPCPPWCVIDHQKDQGGGLRFTHHSDAATFISSTRGGCVGVGRVQADLRAGSPKVSVTSSSEDPGALWLEPRNAVKLAGVIEALAGATLEQHREFAAAVRAAAALIEAESGTGEGRDG
jgi:hypothetical protein